jgi:hypothetical protein
MYIETYDLYKRMGLYSSKLASVLERLLAGEGFSFTALPRQFRKTIWVIYRGTTQQTGSPGSNETDLLTGGGVTRNGRRVANVLVVTTTVRVLTIVCCFS